MATYDLPYAQEHLDELFHDARTGEEVIIVRIDGRSCQLVPLAEVKDEAAMAEESESPDLGIPGVLVPA
jgi:antitoxin (DNA-binding transcriptional repressor) of toxin-antitoxin stability system